MDEMATESLTGRLLVATPVLADPNFRRTVILVVEHEAEEGTLGVVLNRPTDVPVERVLDAWSDLVTGPSVVFKGGPVAPNSALAIGLVPGDAEPLGWHALDGAAAAMSRLGLVDLDAPPDLLAPAIHRLRVYAGYAGWAPGQLKGEIDEGAWYVVPAEPADAFAGEPGELWGEVLRRQGGEMAFTATFPDDPSLN
jgi:putative transcriptional regulator